MQRGAVTVFQAAIDVVAQMQQKQIFGKRGGIRLKHIKRVFADFLAIGKQPLAVKIGVMPAERDAVGDAVCGEMQRFNVCAQLKRAIGERGVVGSLKTVFLVFRLP